MDWKRENKTTIIYWHDDPSRKFQIILYKLLEFSSDFIKALNPRSKYRKTYFYILAKKKKN